MGKYYCDYCDVFLVSESPSVRKAHNSGRNHLTNVRDYYSSLGHDKAQNYIDEITRMFESGPSPGRGSGGGPGPGPSNPTAAGPMRAPFQPGGPGSTLPPFPPAMLALMNGTNGISSSPGSGPPPMRFAGPPIMNNPGGMPPPPGMNGYSSGPHPPPSGPPLSNASAPPLVGGMNPDRARQLGLL